MTTSTITPTPATKLIEILGQQFMARYAVPDVAEHLRKVYVLAKSDDPRWQDFLHLWKEEAPEELHMGIDLILNSFPAREGVCVKPVLFGKVAMVRCGKPAAFSLNNTATVWCAEHVAEDCREPWMKGWVSLGERPESDVREVMTKKELAAAGVAEDGSFIKPRTTKATKTAITEDGIYRNPETGEIFKVQWNRGDGDGRRLYAKRMTAWSEGGFELKTFALGEGAEAVKLERTCFVYVAGARDKLRPEWKLTLEDAKAFGALYGTCVRCGRTLTLEESIERAMGSTCAKKF